LLYYMNYKAMNTENYYKKIKALNIVHYTGETSYYEKAPLRSVENALLKTLKPGSRILDLGCGSGRFSVGVAEQGFGVVGMDITPAAIAAAKNKALNVGVDNVSFLEGDMTLIPFPDNSFDYVFCPRFVINAVATQEKRKKSVTEMIRVVKPDGSVFIESFNKLYSGRGLGMPIRNIVRDIWRVIVLATCRLFKKEYKGLLPGDIVYPNNKVAGAPDGYAHLPTPFEFKKLVPRGQKAKIYSITQILGNRKKPDIFKLFRYSMWIIVIKKVDRLT